MAGFPAASSQVSNSGCCCFLICPGLPLLDGADSGWGAGSAAAPDVIRGGVLTLLDKQVPGEPRLKPLGMGMGVVHP